MGLLPDSLDATKLIGRQYKHFFEYKIINASLVVCGSVLNIWTDNISNSEVLSLLGSDVNISTFDVLSIVPDADLSHNQS